MLTIGEEYEKFWFFIMCHDWLNVSEHSLLIAKLLIEKTAFFVQINIYAPNDYREQEEFIRMLSENIAAKSDVLKVIIAGDWNTTLKQTDKYGGIPWKEAAHRNSIIDLMEELDLQGM